MSSHSSVNAQLNSGQANANVKNRSEKYISVMTLIAALHPLLFPRKTDIVQEAKVYHLKYHPEQFWLLQARSS